MLIYISKNHPRNFPASINNIKTKLILIHGIYFILGLLEPVQSLMWSVTIDMSQLNISWEQPFTLDVPGYDPDIRDYCVYITTLVAPSIVIESNCTEQRYLLYRPPLSLRCHTLNISVIGRNFVGNSHQASVMYNTCYREAACDKEITGICLVYSLYIDSLLQVN